MYNTIVSIFWIRVITHIGVVWFLSNVYLNISNNYQRFVEFGLFVIFILSLAVKLLNIAYCTNAYNHKLSNKDYESISFHLLSGAYNWTFFNIATILMLKCVEIYYCITYFSFVLPMIMVIDLVVYVFKSKIYNVVIHKDEFKEYHRRVIASKSEERIE